ncbi:MAG: hypothetical protein JO227_04495, partial [Acetobacteraceae bacterium]|nr:hypothetical protein [Acetobacteraceae bacterium]
SMALAWERFPWAQAITSFTRALGAAHTGDIAMAKAELGKLDSYHDALVQAKSAYWAGQVEVQRRTAAAAIADAQGGSEEALSLMRSAADLESSTEKHPVTPAPIALARELLGDMMLAMNQPALALAEYQTTLRTDPNRYRSVAGAAEAAQQAGDAAGAKQYYSQLLQICAAADGDRPEIAAARKALAAN